MFLMLISTQNRQQKWLATLEHGAILAICLKEIACALRFRKQVYYGHHLHSGVSHVQRCLQIIFLYCSPIVP